MQANQVGEIITTKVEQYKASGYNFLVSKFINGRFMSSYPAKSSGEATKIENKILSSCV